MKAQTNELDYISHAATALSFFRAASPAARGRLFCRRFSPTFVLAGYSRCQKIWRARRAVIFSAASSADLTRLLNDRSPPINSFWQVPRCQAIRRARCHFFGRFKCCSQAFFVSQISSNKFFLTGYPRCGKNPSRPRGAGICLVSSGRTCCSHPSFV